MSEPTYDFGHLRDSGISTAVAAERLRAAAQHFDLASFELMIAAARPGLWKRMNRKPSRLARIVRLFTTALHPSHREGWRP